MEEQLINFETAKLTKEKNFHEDTLDEFNLNGEENTYQNFEHCPEDWNDGKWYGPDGKDHYSRPSQSILQRWLGENHNIHISIEYMDEVLLYGYSLTNTKTNTILTDGYIFKSQKGASYEEILETALFESLKII